MKVSSTPTHMLGFLLVATAAASCSAHALPHEQHAAVMRGVSHDDLMARAQGVSHSLLHPLDHYALKFIGWALEHGVWFDSLTEGVHALEVRCAWRGRACGWFQGFVMFAVWRSRGIGEIFRYTRVFSDVHVYMWAGYIVVEFVRGRNLCRRKQFSSELFVACLMIMK